MALTIRIVELFAGVGGFRIGLERASEHPAMPRFETVWSSQWEPGTKRQWASEIYTKHFGMTGHSNEDIQRVIDTKFDEIPDHDLLVGGFPCQDYSVARPLNQADGLEGKKGVLWWSIYNILKKKGDRAPSYLMLENVDRLLKSPASQRGRDFAIMLSSLASLGYSVEWRVINAAEYGFPQRRRRVFIWGYKKGTTLDQQMRNQQPRGKHLLSSGVIATAFPVQTTNTILNEFTIDSDPALVSKEFSSERPSTTPFDVAGMMIDNQVITGKVAPNYRGAYLTLGDVLIDEKDVPGEFFIGKDSLEKWIYLKGAKNEPRKAKNGHIYFYTEGSMTFPDPTDKPSRTIITAEGGSSPSRFKHVIKTPSGRLRRLTPVELERLNQFPDNHTEGAPDIMRAFFMGNALVTGIVERLGTAFGKALRQKSPTETSRSAAESESVIKTIHIFPLGRKKLIFPNAPCTYEQLTDDYVQMQLLEESTAYIYHSTRKRILHGTYRKTCRKWIEAENLYNFPVTKAQVVAYPQLKRITHIVLTRKKDKVMFFSVKSCKWTTKAKLKTLGYPTASSRRPQSSPYLLYSLTPCTTIM